VPECYYYWTGLLGEHRPQTTCLYLVVSCAAASIIIQHHPTVPETCCPYFFSRYLFQVFFGCTLLLWPCSAHCSDCLAILSSLILNVCPSQASFIVTGRIVRIAALPVLFLLRPIFRFFAPQGQHVAPIKVKFGRKERTVGQKCNGRIHVVAFTFK